MNDRRPPPRHRPRNLPRLLAAGLIICMVAAIASSQNGGRRRGMDPSQPRNRAPSANERFPEAEFHMGRMIYSTRGGAGSRGYINPWWAVDYPMAEEHFTIAVNRLTNISSFGDSRHVELTDPRLFDYPFLFLQQPGQGNWRPTDEDAERLREYLFRGGFMLVDDFHGEYEWAVFEAAMQKVLPGLPIVDIPDDDPMMHVFYDLSDRKQLPGLRHLRMGRDGQIAVRMEGPVAWRGIYDDAGRLVVAMNFNMDMGDSWEHADDPYYPAEMTGQAYRLGINYLIYAMTH
ncbi:MAG: DUF4159 domain-containing protein [Acidobacteria bacterium]|nr:DUF4159 domain-containing protein [Acidobacteriota bacterium]